MRPSTYFPLELPHHKQFFHNSEMSKFLQFTISDTEPKWHEMRHLHKFLSEEQIRETLRRLVLGGDLQQLSQREKVFLDRLVIQCCHALQSSEAGQHVNTQEAEDLLLNYEFWKADSPTKAGYVAARGKRRRERAVKHIAKFPPKHYLEPHTIDEPRRHRAWEEIYYSTSPNCPSARLLTVDRLPVLAKLALLENENGPFQPS